MNSIQLINLFRLLSKSKNKGYKIYYANKQETVTIDTLICSSGNTTELKVFLSNRELVRFPSNGIAFAHPTMGLVIHKIK